MLNIQKNSYQNKEKTNGANVERRKSTNTQSRLDFILMLAMLYSYLFKKYCSAINFFK